MLYYNNAVHVNIYTEEQANVTYILSKVNEQLQCSNQVLIMPNGMVYYDQEGTRGMSLNFLSLSLKICINISSNLIFIFV